MKKRIGIIGSLCCLGIVICVGIFDTQRKKGNEETIAESVQEIIDEEASTGEVPTDEAPTDETPADEAVAEDPEEEVSPLEASEELTDENEYVNFAIANVDHYVNVRSLPSTTGEIVGKIYDGAVAEIVAVAGEQDEWFQITSGNVEGYIKAEFFLYGEAATEVMDQYVTRFAQVKADRLNVRAGQSTEEACIGHLDQGEKVKLIEDCGEWLHVQYTERKDGYVAAEYVTVLEEYTYAKTLEEEQAQIAAEKEQEEQAKIAVAGEQET
ncbi:MAG: SH3 domain-containing protein, partial [Bacillota bacterium]|nr:SH3 domain-containing protein [Bacillota bacterium]